MDIRVDPDYSEKPHKNSLKPKNGSGVRSLILNKKKLRKKYKKKHFAQLYGPSPL